MSDGTDTLRNIERLQFSDQTIAIGPRAAVATTAAFAARQLGTGAAPQTIVLTNTGNQALHVAGPHWPARTRAISRSRTTRAAPRSTRGEL